MAYTIEVEGFLPHTQEEDVREFFSRVGDVTGCTLKNSRATLTFDNEDDFNEALNMDGMEFENEVVIRVERKSVAEGMGEESAEINRNGTNGANSLGGDEAEASRDAHRGSREEFKVAVRHLAENTTEQQIRELFEPLGTISDLFLEPRRRYAFVGFDNIESLEAALQMTGRELNGIAIEVERKRTGPRENPLESKVVVKGLPPNTTEEELRAFFASAGEPTDLFIHDTKQFAFIGFANEEACSAALRLSGSELNGRRIDIERRKRQRCFKCNREGHVALQCRFSELTCRECGRPGHVARDCRAPARVNRRGNYAGDRRDVRGYNKRDGDRRDYGGYNKRDGDRRDYSGRRDFENREERRRGRSRSDSYDRHHRRRSRSRSRSPKRFARERSRSPSRRRH